MNIIKKVLINRLYGILSRWVPFRAGVTENKVNFSLFDLEVLGIHTDVSALGLLQAVPSVVSYKKSVCYNFLHLSYSGAPSCLLHLLDVR